MIGIVIRPLDENNPHFLQQVNRSDICEPSCSVSRLRRNGNNLPSVIQQVREPLLRFLLSFGSFLFRIRHRAVWSRPPMLPVKPYMFPLIFVHS